VITDYVAVIGLLVLSGIHNVLIVAITIVRVRLIVASTAPKAS